MSHGVAYFNGDWVDAAELRLPLDDLGFILGATVVERLRTFAHRPFRLEAHARRLHRSLEIVGWNAAQLTGEVHAAIEEFLRRNTERLAPGDDWSIVALVTPGKSADAARPTVCVHGFPLPFGAWVRQFEDGISARITDVRQIPPNCWSPELKCRSRMHYYLADREAERREPGARAIVLDQHGRVGEASTANVVCYFHDRGLVTPSVEGVLPGISQEVLFELGAELGWERHTQDLWPADLHAADEIFLTSTSVCMLPIVRVDGRPVKSGAPGPVYRRLLAAWSAHVGVDVAAQAREFASR